MDITIQNNSGLSLYEQIYRQIKSQILSGALKSGDSLPSMRLLAKELRISVITTKRAYEELERDGFIVTRQGQGSFVGSINTNLQREELLKEIEEHLSKAISLSKDAGMNRTALQELLNILQEDQ